MHARRPMMLDIEAIQKSREPLTVEIDRFRVASNCTNNKYYGQQPSSKAVKTILADPATHV
jgi:hypothetical protein